MNLCWATYSDATIDLSSGQTTFRKCGKSANRNLQMSLVQLARKENMELTCWYIPDAQAHILTTPLG